MSKSAFYLFWSLHFRLIIFLTFYNITLNQWKNIHMLHMYSNVREISTVHFLVLEYLSNSYIYTVIHCEVLPLPLSQFVSDLVTADYLNMFWALVMFLGFVTVVPFVLAAPDPLLAFELWFHFAVICITLLAHKSSLWF